MGNYRSPFPFCWFCTSSYLTIFMKSYPTKKIFECIDKISKPGSVLTSQYLENGDFPIVDQGKKFIAGYTNNKSLVYSDVLPVVVFGDHTRAVKFIDFSFAVGADGTKVLKPIDDFEPRFFYYMLLGLDLGGRGYARHFKLLKELEIPLPPLETQKKIVAKLDVLLGKIKEAKKLRAEAQESTNNLLSAELNKIFTEGKAKGWEKKELGELFDITSSKRVFKSEWQEQGVPFYRAREIVSLSKGEPFKTPIFISEGLYQDYKSKYGAPEPGDILVTGVGTLGVSYLVKNGDKFYFKDGNIIWLKKKEDIDSQFVQYFFRSPILKEQIDKTSAGATVRTFTIQTAKRTKIPLPSLSEQKKIVAHLDSLSENINKIQQAQTATADDLIALEQSILHKAFEGGLV